MVFIANAIWRQCYECSKQLQNINIDAALLSETHLKPLERFLISNYHFYVTGRFPGRKGGTIIAVEKHSHKYVDLPPFTSIETSRVFIPIGNSEVVFSIVY
jgi:hypothetical protein